MRAEVFEALRRSLEAERLVALVTVVGGEPTGGQLLVWPGGGTLGDLEGEALVRRAVEAAESRLESQASGRETVRVQGRPVDLFVEVFPPQPTLVMVGAVHVAVPLIDFAARLGFRTVVIDPRTAFATPERFAHADRLIPEWPREALEQVELNEATYFAVLSHDLKIDLPALEAALASPARYIGALGSKKTHARRLERLREAGFGEADLERIHAPIGLDLGGRRAEEIALSVIAQVVAARYGRAG